MRSKSTNILQTIILLTGITYLVIGIFFYFSPLSVISLFADNISENWLDLVKDNELVAPLYYYTRAISSLLFVTGISMVMPLFDPLKYRGMIYFNGVLFPLFACILFMKNGIHYLFRSKITEQAAVKNSALISQTGGHFILFLLGSIFIILFMLSLAGIIITRPEASEGVE